MNKKKQCFHLCILLAAFFAAGCPTELESHPVNYPTEIPYNGFLEMSGTPVTGTYPFMFRIWDCASNGTVVSDVIWEEIHENGMPDNRIKVTDGHFLVYLGSLVPLPEVIFHDGVKYWLEITYFDGIMWQTMSPRKKIISSNGVVYIG